MSGVGPAFLGDADSDGNGILDRDEWGDQDFAPVDTDGDGVPDYKDADDDDDGLTDVYDSDRTTPLKVIDNLGDLGFGFISDGRVDLDDGTVPDAARPGDHLIVSGRDLSCNTVIAFGDGKQTVNAWPVSASSGEVEVVVPDGAGSTVSAIDSDRPSNDIQVAILAAGAPLVAAQQQPTALVGSTLTLHGADLGGVTSVYFGMKETKPTKADAKSLEVQVPADATADSVRVVAGSKPGNEIFLRITEPATATVHAPAGVTPTLVAFGPGQEVKPAADGTAKIEVAHLGVRYVQALSRQGGEDRIVLEAATVPGEKNVTIDAHSTAVALALQASGGARRIALGSLADLLNLAGSVPTIDDLASSIRSAVSKNPDSVWENTSATISQQIADASMDLGAKVDAAVADGSLELAPDNATVTAGGMPTAKIDPDKPQYDISVTQTPGKANIHVANDTQLDISVSIYDTGRKVPLLQHSTRGYGKSVVGGQGPLTRLFSSSEHDFDQPHGRNAFVEIVTPGLLDPQPSSAGATRTQNMLRLRIFVEKFLWPFLTNVLEVKIKPQMLVEVFKSQAAGATTDFLDNMHNANLKAALQGLLNALKRDLESVGPLTKALFGSTARAIGGKIAEAAAKRLARDMIPVLNGIDTALKFVGTTNSVTDALKTAADLGGTPGTLDWSVLFGLGVTNVSPKTIKKLEVDVSNIELDGNEFYPSYDALGNLQIPTITFTDMGKTGFGTYVDDRSQNKFFINADGTHIDHIELPSAYVKTAVGPIEVQVKKGSDTANSPRDITVQTDFALTQLTPSVGVPKDQITVTGKGFANDIRFEFLETNPINGPPKLLDATLVSHTQTSATLIVPDLPSTIKNWTVRAWQTGYLGVRSNGLQFLQFSGYKMVVIGQVQGAISEAVSINNNNVALIDACPQSCVLYSWTLGGTPTPLPDPNGPNGQLAATGYPKIGDSGTIISGSSIYKGGTSTLLDKATPPPQWQSCGPGSGLAINASDKVGGSVDCGNAGFTAQGYASTWNPHAFEAPGFQGGINYKNTEIFDINDSGLVVGDADFANAPAGGAAMFTGGSAVDLKATGTYYQSAAFAVNNNGEVVGFGATPFVALYWPNTGSAPIAFPSAPITEINDINDAGVMLGGQHGDQFGTYVYAPIYISDDHGKTWKQVGADPVDYNGVTLGLFRAYAINNNGIIVGTATDGIATHYYAVALVPTP